MVHYLSAFFIFIVIITGFVLCFTPTPAGQKSISIADSDSKVSMQNKDVIANKAGNIKNTDNINNKQANFKDYNNISTTDANVYNRDNFSNVDTNLNLQDNFKNQGGYGFSNVDNTTPYYPQVAPQVDNNYEPQYMPEENSYEQEYSQPLQQSVNQQAQQSQPNMKVPQYNIQQEQTEEESQQEIISWNIWRSNLGNKIADDNNQWASGNGTYMFYFTVDNQRKITKPVVLIIGFAADEDRMAAYRYLYNLQGSDILQFPSGTKRQKVNAIYTIYIDNNIENKNLNASDFSDYEQIR